MNALTVAKNLIKAHEGLKLKPYLCPANRLTIGYGRNLEGKGISEKEADYLLYEDLGECISDLEKAPYWSKLNSARQAVLIDMRYNLGLVGFQDFKRMHEALQRENYMLAAAEMLASQWATQVKTRAVKLAQIMRSGKIK